MTDQTNADIEAFALLGMTRDIVVAAAASGRTTDLAAAIKDVHAALSGLTQPAVEPVPPRMPIVTARASVTPDAVTCMACGFVGKSLKRHIRVQHGQTPEQYREYWGLKADHPIVAPSYTATRSQLAKKNGLGRKA